MDPLRTALALGPLATYLVVLGLLNLSRRRLVTTAAREIWALGLALSGFAIAGPMELFLPERAAVAWGPYVWVLMLGLYVLCVSLAALLSRPRLIVYNTSLEDLKRTLADVAPRLDSDYRWAGESLALPHLGVQLHLERFSLVKNVSLVAASAEQNLIGWYRLRRVLTAELADEAVTPNPAGAILVAVGLILWIAVGLALARDPESLAQGLFELLRL